MAPKVTDKRRSDLVVPYRHVPTKSADTSAMFTSTLPLAAMFMRNKLLAWAALFTAVQAFLNEPKHKSRSQDAAQPAWVTLLTAVIGMVTCYMDFVIPNMRPTPPVAKKPASS